MKKEKNQRPVSLPASPMSTWIKRATISFCVDLYRILSRKYGFQRKSMSASTAANTFLPRACSLCVLPTQGRTHLLATEIGCPYKYCMPLLSIRSNHFAPTNWQIRADSRGLSREILITMRSHSSPPSARGSYSRIAGWWLRDVTITFLSHLYLPRSASRGRPFVANRGDVIKTIFRVTQVCQVSFSKNTFFSSGAMDLLMNSTFG